VAVERDELRAQLPNLLDEVAYQLGLGALADVGAPSASTRQPSGWRLAIRCTRSDGSGCFGKPDPRAWRMSASVALGRSSILAAAARSGTVSKSQTMTDCSVTVAQGTVYEAETRQPHFIRDCDNLFSRIPALC
jgi:hypothetical protein